MPRFRISGFGSRLILLVFLSLLVGAGLILFELTESALPRSVFLLGLVGTLALSIAWFASDLATLRRIEDLVEVSRRLSGGDLSARSGPSAKEDEIGRLARAFDEMAATLEERQKRQAEAEQALRRSQDEFRHAQKLQAMGQLAGGVAHDFNNLLTVITGYGEILLSTLETGDPRRASVEEILKASQRAASLTRQLLAFSRKQLMSPRILNLNTVVAETDRMLRRVIGEDIRLELRMDPSLGTVRADPGQIEQVLMNLAVNARDAMPEGGRLLIETSNVDLDEAYVREHPEARPGPHVLLSVSDTGCGMDEQVLSRLFEPFFTTKEPGKGTGLGLSTVYGIVRQSGGSIRVTSQPGKGSTFWIYLPRCSEEAGRSETPSSARHAAVRLGTETILVVEDSDVVRKLVRDVLATRGYCVLEARNGREAVQVCENWNGPLHLLLTDVVMPEAGGRDLADYLTSLHPSMKVLYMSGYAETAFFARGFPREGTAFISKPFTPAQIARKVREVLDGKPGLPPPVLCRPSPP